MFTLPGNRDIELPREGQSVLSWAIEITRRANRRIHGEMVVEAFGDILIRTPKIPPLPPTPSAIAVLEGWATGYGLYSNVAGKSDNLTLTLPTADPTGTFSLDGSGYLQILATGTYALDFRTSVNALIASMPTYNWSDFTASVGGAAGRSGEGHFHWTVGSIDGSTPPVPTITGRLGSGMVSVVDLFTVAVAPTTVSFKILAASDVPPTLFTCGIGANGNSFYNGVDTTCRIVQVQPY